MAAGRAPLSLKARALQLLAQREHSRLELRRKLLRHAQRLADAQIAADGDSALQAEPADDVHARVEEVLDWLVAQRHLDERRFVESRIHVRQARFGNRRIEQELQRHGVSLDTGDTAALRRSELARAREVWSRKFGSAPEDAAARARQMRFLAGRGFSSDVIRRVIAGADGDDRGDDRRHGEGDD